MKKFKVGDKVKVVKNTAYRHHCEIGSTVEIIRVCNDTDLECKKNKSNTQILHVNDVEPLNTQPQFSVGDTVSAVENGQTYHGEIESISGDNTYVTIDTKSHGSVSFFTSAIYFSAPAKNKEQMKHAYKKGDRIKLLSMTQFWTCFKIGNILTVQSVQDCNTRLVASDDKNKTQVLHFDDIEPYEAAINQLPEGTIVRRLNMPVHKIPAGAQGVATGKTTTVSGGPLYQVHWHEYDRKTYSRLENLEIIKLPNQTAITANADTQYKIKSVTPDRVVLETSTGRVSGPKINVQNIRKDQQEAVRMFREDAFSIEPYKLHPLYSPTKENTMSLKIKTTYTVQGTETKNFTVDFTAEAIREQAANIKALEDLPVKTNKISEQIEELKADLTAFIDHMDSLPKSKS